MSARVDLRTLQRWMSFVVQHPATADIAVANRRATALVPKRTFDARGVVLGNERMTPADQLQVYNGAYLARLVEVMQGDFGAVQHVTGPQLFERLVARYLTPHPSRHPNLNQLGRQFAAFLSRQRTLAHRSFLVELATLERAMSEAFDAPEFEPMDPGELARVPAERWHAARFVANPSVELLSFRYPIDEFFQAWKDGEPRAVPRRRASWLCVYRRDDRVWRQRLQKPAHAVLAALCAGRPLGEALELAAGAGEVGEWFQGFARDGLFTAVQFRGGRRARPRSRS
ncbi:MAG TPA: DNA-binding domain-containing protein [Planctomycetota bacterium]|nr:DNA-binding domain-containing protein [Planctomycetota bacterium]